MIYLTESEAALIVDALNGIIIDPALTESVLWQEVEEAIRHNDLDPWWNMDGSTLVAKLKTCDNADALRIVKLAQDFWVSERRFHDTYQRVRQIGLANAVESDDELITVTAAAALCGRSPANLGALVLRGKLSAFRDPIENNPRRQTRYRKSEILKLKKP